jgi:hypothetical protein
MQRTTPPTDKENSCPQTWRTRVRQAGIICPPRWIMSCPPSHRRGDGRPLMRKVLLLPASPIIGSLPPGTASLGNLPITRPGVVQSLDVGAETSAFEAFRTSSALFPHWVPPCRHPHDQQFWRNQAESPNVWLRIFVAAQGIETESPLPQLRFRLPMTSAEDHGRLHPPPCVIWHRVTIES